ncbi:thiol peroxidase [Flammeovirga pacifica]|uniref:Thiol peroxidase n=1 Tax=Flammeovirga pacifica TaxID=915059 RepID=A0A1S1Z0G6_FLAPC|nr:thiol peroxidase [Flammeovirga pacifica]OHX66764.1 lipid hydroperoxide peroxidase [Flammeovirga pacifica]
MAQITLKGNAIQTIGELPAIGSSAPDFSLVKSDLSDIKLSDFAGKKVILNIFPSVDTGTCAMSTRTFNEKASSLDNTVVICVSKDLPFAFGRFCGAEGIEDVLTGSSFRDTSFEDAYGLKITTGPLTGLCSRSIVVIDENGKVAYTEQVTETVDEPNYEAAIAAL